MSEQASLDIAPDGPTRNPSVLVVIVNWNAWRLTTECLESAFKLAYDRFDALVCDNASDDGSVGQLMAWAGGRVVVEGPATPSLDALVNPPTPKPIAASLYDAELTPASSSIGTRHLIVLASSRNRGFAGGSNCGLRYALKARYDYVWLLNNDTVVSPDSLTELVRVMRAHPKMGQCGSTLRYYAAPDRVQALGGAFYGRIFARTSNATSLAQLKRPLSYIIGASMLIRRELLESIGILDERYFLYFEELDLAARSKGFGLGYAPNSVVFHHEGATSGTAGIREHRSPTADYYLARARVVFTSRFHPQWFVTVVLGVLGTLLKRVLQRQWRNAGAVMHGLCDAFRGIEGPRE